MTNPPPQDNPEKIFRSNFPILQPQRVSVDVSNIPISCVLEEKMEQDLSISSNSTKPPSDQEDRASPLVPPQQFLLDGSNLWDEEITCSTYAVGGGRNYKTMLFDRGADVPVLDEEDSGNVVLRRLLRSAACQEEDCHQQPAPS